MIGSPLHLMDQTAVIQRPAITRDSGGSPIETYAQLYTGVACRVRTYGGNEGVRYGRENVRYTHGVYFPGGTDVLEKDRVVVASKTLDVQAVVNFDLQNDYLRADCQETKP